jgi:glutathione S-transferase
MEPDLAAADKAEAEEMPKIYDYLESVLPDSGWLIEDRFTLADLAAACPLINVSYVSEGLDAARWPKTAAWLAAVKARPSVAAAMAEEAHAIAAMMAK